MAASHFPTASEAFQVVTKAVQQGTFRDFEVVLEYADGPDGSIPSAARKLSSMRQEKSNTEKRPYQPAFRPPCGWQRIWRITHQDEILWDRQARGCTLNLSLPAGNGLCCSAGPGFFGLLPAAVLARVVLSCDLPSLLTLAAALPAIGGSGAMELGEAMPSARSGERWLSFARAALRWAEFLGGLRQGLAKRKGKDSWGDRVAPGAFTTCATDEASCAASAVPVLATGHQDGVRLWGLPGGTKMGLVKTKSPVLALDLGNDLLAAVMVCPQSPQLFGVALWDLTSLGTGMGPIWQAQVPTMLVHFLGPNVLVSSPKGAQLLCASTGQVLETIDLGGPPGSSCKCSLPSTSSSRSYRDKRNQHVLLAMKQKVFAVTEGIASTTVQRSDVFEFADSTEDITALSCSSTEVAAATSAHIFVWRLVDRVLLARLPAISDLDLENLSWSVCRAETLAGLGEEHSLSIAEILMMEELLVCCVNLGQPGQDSAACAFLAWHVPTCSRLPHPWHLAGPLEASPSSRANATAPVLLPGISVGRLMADPSLRWVTVSHFSSSSKQPVASVLTRAPAAFGRAR